jgi:UDP-GlcNAc:undecaprenyl-phosphate GlcNAc-1-phosphate transferase
LRRVTPDSAEESSLTTVLLGFAVAFVAATLLTPICRRVAHQTGFLAHPSSRGVHERSTPLLGGVAIFFAFVTALAAARALAGAAHGPIFGFLGGGALIFVMGVIDDKLDLSWFSKLLGQIVAAVLLLASESEGGSFFLTPSGLVLSLFWVVGIANAMNFLDNMDGICAGIAVVVSASFAALAILTGQWHVAVLAAALAGASAGFLRYNFHPARIFLGDGGSLFLGYSLASISLMIMRETDFSVSTVVPVIALAYPVFDITYVSVTRSSRGQSLAQGGKDHSSHRLARVLGGAPATAWVIYGICVALGAVALLLNRIAFAPATVVAATAVFFAFVAFGIHLSRAAPVPDQSTRARPAVS